jgi:IclR family transcriptional regulator, acetate operon repressor
MNVKSAVRVLEVLEYFDAVQRAASLSEIAAALGYPLSSTSMLLHSLVERGYLAQGEKRAYRLTPRVKLLGGWLSPLLDANGPVAALMGWVGAQCQQLVVLAVPETMQVRYIRVVPATGTVRMHVTPGAVRALPNSGFGRLFMSQMSDEEVEQVLRAHNAQQPSEASRLGAAALRRDLQAIRSTGYSVSFDKVSPGAGVVAVRLPVPINETPLAVGIGGPSALIRSNATAYGALLQDGVRRFCGPAIAAAVAAASASAFAATRAPRSARAQGAAA